jgi:hypothetical protein
VRDLPNGDELASNQDLHFFVAAQRASCFPPSPCSMSHIPYRQGRWRIHTVGRAKGGRGRNPTMYESSVTKASTDSPFRQLID